MKLKYILLAIISVLSIACKKELSVKEVDFDVVADKVTIKQGESVKFTFEGNPNNIVFYSGENLKDYAYSAPGGRETTGPDRPAVLKGYQNPMIPDYTYKYAAAGVYKATFVASNLNIDDIREVVRQIEITVTAPAAP